MSLFSEKKESFILRRLKGLFVSLYHLFFFRLNPLGYVRYLGVKIGSNVHFYSLKPGMFSTEPWLITIGNNVHITSGCQFVTHDGGTLVLRKYEPSLELTAPIVVGNDVYLGMNTIVLPGVTIGDNVVVVAGSVVSKSLPSGAVYAGVPARRIKSIEEYLESVKQRSLGFGHLPAKEKEVALKQYFKVE
jgi:acetyltransferase-like isoleucine patch superfamily enzyme